MQAKEIFVKAVMEVQTNKHITYWLAEMIAGYNLQLVRSSKYCRNIGAARNMVSIQQHIPVAEGAEDVQATKEDGLLHWGKGGDHQLDV